MSGPIATLDPATPKIPDELWKQSGTPITGLLIRGWIALVLIGAGWILVDVTGSVYPWALAAVGIAAFFAVPALVESLVLARLSAKVDAIELGRDADKAHAVLDELRRNPTAKMLAPHGWLRVQEGRVHLAVGDGRAAAKSFAEAERVSTFPDKHQLVSAQAHALVLAGDRKEARELLVKLRKADALSDLDHLNFGVVLLSEAGHNQEALGHLQQAREAFADHPRALAGLVLALQRCDKTDEAAALLGATEAAVDNSTDQVAQDLLKRAKKGLRPLLKAKQKRERKGDKQAEPSEGAPSADTHKPKGKKGRKQARRDARKKAKAEARRGEPSGTSTAGDEAALASEQVEAEATTAPKLDEPERDDAERDDAEAGQSERDSDREPARDDEPATVVAAEPEPVEPAAKPEPVAPAKPEPSKSTDEDIDLATLALQALGSGSRRKLDESEGGPSSSGLRPIEPSSSGSMFRSAVFDEPKPSASGSLFRSAVFEEPTPSASSSPDSPPSLFSLPKFDSVPTFAPPPKPTRGAVLPTKPRDEIQPPSKPESAPKPAPPPKPTAPPSVTVPPMPPKIGVPAASSILAPKPVATAKPAAPALDDGWGDLGDIEPLPAPPVSPATDKAED